MQKYGLQIAKCKLQISNSQPKTGGIDCMALASFTHPHDIPGLHPPFPPSEGIGGGPKRRGVKQCSGAWRRSPDVQETRAQLRVLSGYRDPSRPPVRECGQVANPNGVAMVRKTRAD